MRVGIARCLLALSLVTFGTQAVFADPMGEPTGRLIAVTRSQGAGSTSPSAAARGIRQAVRENLVQSFADDRVLVLEPPQGQSWQAYRQQLLNSGLFESVEPDTIAQTTATPNDSSFNTQWHLFQISAPRAWDFVQGSSSPIVAIVDGGVDVTHPDLAPNLVPGYNTISGLPQASGGVVTDVTTSGHGTRCAGIAAAAGNNNLGVSGVGWNLRVMPIRATDNASGSTPRSELLEGVQWAVNNGAKVVSVSYTEVQFADVEAMGAWARSQGALLVWSAGNSNTNWSTFDHINVVVVGGTDQNDQRWNQNVTTGSGFGRGVDILAPCVQVFTLRKGGGYGNAPAGVSFAVPQVAASLALMFERVGNLDPTVVELALYRRARDLGPRGNDLTFGWGRLSVGNAIASLNRRYILSALPLPAGYSQARLETMNDMGDAAGVATNPGGGRALVYWRNGQVLAVHPVSGFSAVNLSLYEMNNQGALVGDLLYNANFVPQVRGFRYTPENGFFLIEPIGLGPNTFVRGINESGTMVGIDGTLNSSDERAWIWYAGAPQRVYINQQLGFSNALGLNDSNEVVGRVFVGGGNQMFTWDGVLTRLLDRTVGLGYSADQGAINESGRATNAVWLGGNNLQPVSFNTFSSTADTILIPTPGISPWDLNNFDEIVGTHTQGDSNPSNDQAFIIDGYQRGPLTDFLSQPLANPLFALREIREVNDLGEMGGLGADQFGQEVPFIARPVENPGLAVSLGQLGSSPTYIGSIPPLLSVTYTDPNGVPYPNSTVLQAYTSLDGRMGIQPPPSVTGNYRVFMRCNPTAIPGYDGPIFLSRLYPPFGTPAAPRDISFLPFSSEANWQDQPILVLYPGDCDGNGEIDLTDIDIAIAAYGNVNGDPGYLGAADVDGSGEIDLTDIDIIIANYGLAGDPEP